MCLKQFLSKYSIISAKVAGCFVPRGVDRLDAKVHHSRHICLLGFVGFKNRAAREIRTQFARAIKLFRTTLIKKISSKAEFSATAKIKRLIASFSQCNFSIAKRASDEYIKFYVIFTGRDTKEVH